MKVYQKIGIKLIVAVGTTTAIILGLFAYFNLQSQNTTMVSEVERHAHQLSETIKKGTRTDMLDNDREHIHNIINTIGNEPSIKKIRVLNKEGEIIYSKDGTEIGEVIDKKAESCYVCHAENKPLEKLPIKDRTRIFKLHPDSSRVMGVINPIYNELSCYTAECHAHPKEQKVLGVLDIIISLDEADEQLSKSTFGLLTSALIALAAISLIIAFFVKRWVDKPVNQLVEATNNVAVGNLSYKMEESGKDELNVLKKSFNNMTKKLSEMRTQLVQSDKMASLGRLAAGVAHEINNPLTGVLTYSSFLLKRAGDNPELRDDLEVIVRETKRSREIVKGLLDFARQSTPKKGKANINEIIEHSILVVTNQLKLNHVTLTKKLDDNLPEIIVDANQIQQVFINLIVNSIDAIGSNGGEISIQSSTTELMPYGITQIRAALCPKRHNLMDEEHKIDGMPSIKIKATSKRSEGFIHLDPIYGRHQHHYGIPFDENETIQFSCPECGISLIDTARTGPDNKTPVFVIEIPDKGELLGCTKYLCKWQKWTYMDHGGRLKFIEVKFSDNGCGISKDQIANIFDPFFTTKGQKGTGLGLAVVWGIIDNHNGKIEVESKPGEGTTFTLRLPIN